MAEVLTEVAGVRIAGRTVTPIEETSFEVVEPATGAPIARVGAEVREMRCGRRRWRGRRSPDGAARQPSNGPGCCAASPMR